jgi:hypothetical protein
VRTLTIVASAICAAGCVTTSGNDVVSFQPASYQQATLQDGDTIITSRAKNSVVTVRPATHLVAGRPVFIVGIENISRTRLDFRVSEANAGQIVDGTTHPLRVYTYDEIVAQEKNEGAGRTIVASVLGVSANSDNTLTLDTGNGEALAAAQETNQKNMQDLEQLALKDRTLMPGESYAGKLYLEQPADSKGPKHYYFDLKVGPDRHEFQIVQAPAVR